MEKSSMNIQLNVLVCVWNDVMVHYKSSLFSELSLQII